jgi:dephospho-CoA kinase
VRLIGLTGGLATGKSHVGRMLEKLGCRLIQADQLGHRTLAPDGEAYHAVVEKFGTGIVDENSLIDRKALASLVFHDPERLAELNAIVHPAVNRLQAAMVAEIVAGDPEAIVVIEAAIHIETGGYKRFEKLILVVCSREEQIRRAMKRDHSTREEVLSRIDRQMPLEEKRRFADYVIDTTGDEAQTWVQTVAVYNQIKKL